MEERIHGIETMQAAVLVAQNRPLEMKTVEMPKTLGYGQVLVKINYSSICGAQIGEIAGVGCRWCGT
jgi:S-(hydroxymethyl)glutathione dehydrogenase/alcohol dehydrogenase